MSENFGLVIPELGNARIRRTSDGWFSVFDLIRVVAGQKSPRKVWERLSVRNPEVVTKCHAFKFTGRGQQETPVTDRKGWLCILAVLPGVAGSKYRQEAADLVIRYIDADINLAADIVERNNNPKDLAWMKSRVDGKIERNRLTGIYKSHGVTGRGYADCTNNLYRGLFGEDAKGLKKRKGLSKTSNLRDHASSGELSKISFTETLAGQRVISKKANGNIECADITHDTAKRVADFTQDLLSS